MLVFCMHMFFLMNKYMALNDDIFRTYGPIIEVMKSYEN